MDTKKTQPINIEDLGQSDDGMVRVSFRMKKWLRDAMVAEAEKTHRDFSKIANLYLETAHEQRQAEK